MLYTVARLGKGTFGRDTFLGAFINKCRQVVQKSLPKTIDYNQFNPISDNLSTSLNSKQLNQITPICNAHTTNALMIVTNNRNESYRTDTVRNLVMNSAIKAAKTLEERIGLPPRPKRPLSPYFRYMKEERNKLVSANPHIKGTDVIRQLAKNWNTVDPKVKQRLIDEYKHDQEKYVERLAQYDAKVTDEDRQKIKVLKAEIKDAKEKRFMRKKQQDLGRPKRPPSSFLRFVSNERMKTPQLPQQSYRDWYKKTSDKWNQLSESEKNVYEQKTRKEFEEYQSQLHDWERKMIQQGNTDVVRNSSLIDQREAKPKSKAHKL